MGSAFLVMGVRWRTASERLARLRVDGLRWGWHWSCRVRCRGNEINVCVSHCDSSDRRDHAEGRELLGILVSILHDVLRSSTLQTGVARSEIRKLHFSSFPFFLMYYHRHL